MTTLQNAQSGKQRLIVTFHRKDLRQEPHDDKLSIARSIIHANSLHLDINLYSAPILVLDATDEEAERLRLNPNISSVVVDDEITAQGDVPIREATPINETVPVGVAQIGAQKAWDASRGKGIRVAIIDTGIDAQHPDLAANVKGTVSFVPGESSHDEHGSGTHLAGIIGAAQNGHGIVGVAPAVSLFAVKVFGRTGIAQTSWILQGINWCIQNKMHIVCMPFGSMSPPVALETICQAAFDSGLLLFATAGVNGMSVPAPARYRKVIAASSVDGSDVITPYSGRGPEVEICGPGVNVLSTVPGGGYRAWSGAAAAAAHVTGAAALTWGSHRFATNQQIWNVLAGTARPLGSPGWDPSYGYGRVQADLAALCPAPMASSPLRP